MSKLELDKPIANTQTARAMLEAMRPEIEKALANKVKPEMFLRVALTSFSRTPKLLECTGESILKCLMACAELGIVPDTSLQHAHLVPYGNECTLIIGYRGLIELINRSGKLSSPPYTEVVRKDDNFRVIKGTDRRIVHEPEMVEDYSTRPLTHVYSVVRYGMDYDFEVMDRADVERIRDKSKLKNGIPWKEHFDEMARKTVLRRHAKRLPMSEEFRRAEQLDDEQYERPVEARVLEPKQLASAGTLRKNLEAQAQMQADGETEKVDGRSTLESRLREAVRELESAGGHWDVDSEIEDMSVAQLRKELSRVEAKAYRASK